MLKIVPMPVDPKLCTQARNKVSEPVSSVVPNLRDPYPSLKALIKMRIITLKI